MRPGSSCCSGVQLKKGCGRSSGRTRVAATLVAARPWRWRPYVAFPRNWGWRAGCATFSLFSTRRDTSISDLKTRCAGSMPASRTIRRVPTSTRSTMSVGSHLTIWTTSSEHDRKSSRPGSRWNGLGCGRCTVKFSEWSPVSDAGCADACCSCLRLPLNPSPRMKGVGAFPLSWPQRYRALARGQKPHPAPPVTIQRPPSPPSTRYRRPRPTLAWATGTPSSTPV